MKNRVLFAIMIACLLLSCNRKERIISEIEMLSNQKISFVDGYVELHCNSDIKLDSLLKRKIKVVSYVTDISCSSCGVKTLKIYQREIKKSTTTLHIS